MSITDDRVVRIAIVGTCTTRPIADLLLPLCVAESYWAEVYEGNYQSWATDPLDRDGSLHAFRPDIVLMATSATGLEVWPSPGDSEEKVRALADEVIANLEARWSAITSSGRRRIIQHNFEAPTQRLLGRLDARTPWSKSSFVQQLNSRLWGRDGADVRIMDVHALSADVGRLRWSEPRWYCHGKFAFDPMMIRHYANSLAGLLRGLFGRTRKCLVVDLDNTLWGGVVGDSGVEGVAFGVGTPTGEAYLAFARYLKELRGLGVLLAVNSKNDATVAREFFARHPESPLKCDDFAAFVCNWEPKSANLGLIASQLNIGVESLVFVDDNPAECAEVRRVLPGTTVIELAGDPAGFPRLIEEQHLFTPLDLTATDLMRAESYGGRKKFAGFAGASGMDLESFWNDLEMEAAIDDATGDELPRLEQLFAKTNQFNLSGLAFTQDELRSYRASPNHRVVAVHLKDRHARHGLVSGLVLEKTARQLSIINWIMSCRVFTRTLEEFILSWLLGQARMAGWDAISVTLKPTSRNEYAQKALVKLGFIPRAGGLEGDWQIELVSASDPTTFVKTSFRPAREDVGSDAVLMKAQR